MRLRLGDRDVLLAHRALVMGVVNRTPDSFSDGGQHRALGDALDRALAHEAAGADLVDVGGVRAGPGAPVSEDEELERVVPFVEQLRARSRMPVSVDTTRPAVAAAALDAGAQMVNDVSGLADPRLAAEVARRPGASLVVVFPGGALRSRPLRAAHHPDVTGEAVEELRRLAALAVRHGVEAHQIVIDPGHDLGKTTAQSLELTRRLPDLVGLGHPVLVALSRKDFLSEALGGLEMADRTLPSVTAAAVAVVLGARIVRVHDVAETVAALRTVEAVLGWRDPPGPTRGLV